MLVISLPLGLVFLVSRAQRQPPQLNPNLNGGHTEGLFLFGGVRDWDMDTKTLAVRFIPHYCYSPSHDQCVHIPFDVLFFKDMDALGIGGFNESSAVLAFREATGHVADHGRFDQFNLEVPESPRSGQDNDGGLESDAMYPFDWYEVRMLFGATLPDLNTTVPIVEASIFNYLATLWRYDLRNQQIEFNSHATKINLHIRLSRTVVVKISALLILILNWVVTVGIVYMVIASTAGRRHPPDGFDIVALPFAALFALPQVRSVMPGDPPFGCLLDFIGIIPNLTLIAVSGTVLLVVRVHRAKLHHKIQPE
ncbi:hypothetical protein EXIGLDRAFT_768436 [Exidia glandulosa HHB12029]|uniref:Uncharacterized protein n=1 Tax=Exidia glandulosa HHB12029 TaxID=1314781 RepID=A0A165I7A7_EXIGL|nr:hypothetical protein EXIGLDRAFT_768436 [Exidia glandulosa HHB12029]